MPPLLVGRVVAAGPVGARDDEPSSLANSGARGDSIGDVADDADGRALARHGDRRSPAARSSLGRGGDEHGVGAAAGRQPRAASASSSAASVVAKKPAARASSTRAGSGSTPSATQPAAAQQLERELADEPEADDRGDVAEPGLGQPHAVQRDRGDRRVGGVLGGDALRARARRGCAARATTSACDASPAPAQATSSPGAAGASSQRLEHDRRPG